MDQRLTTGYKVLIGILVIALIIAVWGWVAAANDENGDFGDAVDVVQAEIQTSCADVSTVEGQERCADVLVEFREVLFDYEEIIEDIGQAPPPASGAATTTGTATGTATTSP